MIVDEAPLHRVLDEGPPILFATISGAHLYGFPSADSDVDLRGCYVLPLRAVLGLKLGPETMSSTRMDGPMEIDFAAHDVLKFVRLLTHHNGSVLEHLFSPLVVRGGPWFERLKGLGQTCVTRSLYHHYRGFFWNQRRMLSKPHPTVKMVLYAYRVLLTGIHALQEGVIEANLVHLQDIYRIPFLEALIFRKVSGDEKTPLQQAEIDEHVARLDYVSQQLEETYLACKLPEAPTAPEALNQFVIEARLALGQ